MANIANVKVRQGNVLELSGSSVSISGSGGLNLHTQHVGINAYAGTGNITLDSDNGTITLDAGLTGNLQLTGSAALKGDLNVSGTITAHTLNIVETTVTTLAKEGSTKFGNDSGDLHEFTGSVKVDGPLEADSLTGSLHYNQLDQITNRRVILGTSTTPELRELSGSNGITVDYDSDASKIIFKPGNQTEFVTTGTEDDLGQNIPGLKIFRAIEVTGAAGLKLHQAAPLVASGSITVTGSALTLLESAPLVASGSVTITGSAGLFIAADSKLVNSGSTALHGSLTLADGSVINSSGASLAKSLSLTGILDVAAAATGSLNDVAANTVILAADGSEVELPAVSEGKFIIVKKKDGGVNGVRVLASGSQTIDGVANTDPEGPFYLYGPYQSAHLVGSGSGWFVL